MRNEDIAKDVKGFYEELPFNFSEDPKVAAEYIRTHDSVRAYHPLCDLLSPVGKRVLDVGSGAGWLSLNIAYHYNADVTGIDFNPVAISRARTVGGFLGVNVEFKEADLFEYFPDKFPLVVSIGVLHHTKDCMKALRHICTEFVSPGGDVLVGLYHLYGRRPLLEHFQRLKNAGASRQELLNEYKRLDRRFTDDPVHLESWFRDQIMHPHETQHTLAELIPVFEGTGMSLQGTSLNGYKQQIEIQKVLKEEEKQEKVSIGMLKEGNYAPGFFTVWAKKAPA